MPRSQKKKNKSQFFDTEVIGVISEWMWALIIFTALIVCMAALFG